MTNLRRRLLRSALLRPIQTELSSQQLSDPLLRTETLVVVVRSADVLLLDLGPVRPVPVTAKGAGGGAQECSSYLRSGHRSAQGAHRGVTRCALHHVVIAVVVPR